MTDFPISGGCQCGAVRYTVHGPPSEVAHCHCSMCRKTNGSLFWTGATVAAKHLTIEGEANLTSYQSSPNLVRQFCETCGLHIGGATQTLKVDSNDIAAKYSYQIVKSGQNRY